MHLEREYKLGGKEKRPSNLHPSETSALRIVIKMAYGNMHCRRTDERMDALKLVENMVKSKQ